MKSIYVPIILPVVFILSTYQSIVAQNALNFDGTGDYVTATNASSLIANQNLSISFWVYPTNAAPSFPNFDGFAGFRDNSNADFFILQLSPTNIEARFRNSLGANYDILYTGLQLNTWNHFVMTYDGSTLTLYHNGVSVGTEPATGFITSTTETFYMGNLLFQTTNFYLNGGLDDVCLWSKSLSSSEVNTLYNTCAVNLNSSNLELCYEFNQGIAGGNNTAVTSIIDSKNNINGTPIGLAMNGSTSNFVSRPALAINNTNANICGGNYTTPGGQIVSTTGIYYDTIPNGSFNGCDSIIVTNLTVGNHSSTSINPVSCGVYTSPSGNTWTTSGTYNDTLSGFAGCDSVLVINLTIANNTTNTINVQACIFYMPPSGGDPYFVSGTYTDIIPNAVGCDSVITINAIINNQTSSTIMVQSCDTYTSPSGNNVWTTSGTYTDVIPNAAGCDSTITINLTIETIDVTVTQDVHRLTATQVGATYQWIDCDNANASIPNETNQKFTPTVDGNYAVVVTVNGCSDTSNCFNVMPVNTFNILASQVNIYPNPTSEKVQIDLGETYSNITIQVSDLVGKIVQTMKYNQNRLINLNIEQPNGIYFLEIIADNQRVVVKILLE